MIISKVVPKYKLKIKKVLEKEYRVLYKDNKRIDSYEVTPNVDDCVTYNKKGLLGKIFGK